MRFKRTPKPDIIETAEIAGCYELILASSGSRDPDTSKRLAMKLNVDTDGGFNTTWVVSFGASTSGYDGLAAAIRAYNKAGQ